MPVLFADKPILLTRLCLPRIATDPVRNRRPGLLQRSRAHEQADMATRNEFLLDLLLWRSEIFLTIEDLFRCGDVIRCTR
jgi:hypothetical protein